MLDENAVIPCLDVMKHLLHNIFSFFDILKLEKSRFEMFIAWMFSVLSELERTCDNPPSNIPEAPLYKPAAVADFLEHHILQSPLRIYLSNEERRSTEIAIVHTEPESDRNNKVLAKPFRQLLRELKYQRMRTFAQPQTFLESQCAIDHLLPFHHLQSDMDNSRIRIWSISHRLFSMPETGIQNGYCCLIHNQDDSLQYYTISLDTEPTSIFTSTRLVLCHKDLPISIQDFDHVGDNKVVGIGHVKGLSNLDSHKANYNKGMMILRKSSSNLLCLHQMWLKSKESISMYKSIYCTPLFALNPLP